MDFELNSKFKPSVDQEQAINKLVKGVQEDKKVQVLLGATGTGKTFTMANVIQKLNRPTLILTHNKTLANQLYSEFKEFFPKNRVEYFISNFDFYQPEAYIPKTDTYIEKNADMNEEIDLMRSSAVNSVLSRNDTIVICSVAAIYALNNPEEYNSLLFTLRVGEEINRQDLLLKLVTAQYKRSTLDLGPKSFRVRGDIIDISTTDNSDYYLRIELFDNVIERLCEVDALNNTIRKTYTYLPIYPAETHASRKESVEDAVKTISVELEERIKYYNEQNKPLEAERIEQRTRRDMESMLEFGMCAGIENYSRHIDKRKEGETPYTIFDYFPNKDYLVIVDESHVSLPQVRGMFNGDRSRKETLVEYGFRLPSALDNRPLMFNEFMDRVPNMICTSATPGDYELEQSNGVSAEQIIRPTGLLDPLVEVKPTLGQIDDIIVQIQNAIKNNERVLITTLTIRMAEELSNYLKNRNINVAYLHNEFKTFERSQIIYELRKGKYDVVVGINLLREGLDIPEVSTILILDADKEGFLRSSKSLIQIIGRAARNEHGKVIMYADSYTDSMKIAIEETNRRRSIQEAYNKEHDIIPHTIVKEIKEPIHLETTLKGIEKIDNVDKLSKKQKEEILADLEKQMRKAAKDLDFEKAAELRDTIIELRLDINN